ncbi:MAG TPA: response regulator [Thermomicrobiales bacterium]|nr:response regulator [Thermomicrobiales bacterium]
MSTLRPREDARRQHERPHVLIVTDDPSLIDFLGEGLVMGGFWTSVISHGLQALEVFRHRQFDLLVIDRDLGTFDAVELMERLRGLSERGDIQPRSRAPVVVMASGDADLDVEQQERLGIATILQAPVELEDVVQTLHRVFVAWRDAHPDVPLADES